jgi:hypothetical protein
MSFEQVIGRSFSILQDISTSQNKQLNNNYEAASKRSYHHQLLLLGLHSLEEREI